MFFGWMGGFVLMFFGLSGPETDLPTYARNSFDNLLLSATARAASEAYQAYKMKLSADLAEKALLDQGLAQNERRAMLYLHALALSRAGRASLAVDAFRLFLKDGRPDSVGHHADWYYGKLLIETARRTDEEQLEQGRLALARVPPLSRFGLEARVLLVDTLIRLGRLDQATNLAQMAVDHYTGTSWEHHARLMWAKSLYRLGLRRQAAQGARQSLGHLQKAASLFQEVSVVWPHLSTGKYAANYLALLKKKGIYPEPADAQKWVQRALEIVSQRQRRRDLLVLRKIQSLFPRSTSSSVRYMMEVLYAELAARYRMFDLAQKSTLRVLGGCKDKHICARAGFLLAGLKARTSIRAAIRAYLDVDRRFSDSTYGPLALYKGGEIARRYRQETLTEEVFQRCVDQYPDSASTDYCRWGLGWMAFQAKQYQKALSWFDSILVKDLELSDEGLLNPIDDFPADAPELVADERLGEDPGPSEGEQDELQAFENHEPVVMELPYRFSRQLERRRFRERVQYWRARTYHELSCYGKALSGYKRLVTDHPYDYYSLMAWENLSALGADLEIERYQGVVCEQLLRSPGYSESGVNHPDVTAAELYLRMGLEHEAKTTIKAVDPAYLGPADRRIASLIWLALGDYERSHRIASVPWEGGLPGFIQSPASAIDACLAYPKAYSEIVEGPSRDPQVEADLIFALMRAESAFNHRAKSAADALGLTQVIRQTAYRIARKQKLRHFRFYKLLVPEIAIQVGSAYLGELKKLFGGNLVLTLAAYNAGERAVKRWLRKAGESRLDAFIEEIPYTETNRYVKKLLSFYAIYRALYQKISDQPLNMNLASVAASSGFTTDKTAWATSRDH